MDVDDPIKEQRAIVRQKVEALTDALDNVESALTPLLNAPVSTLASKLPVLDKAKLYVHAAYSIESLLFSSLRLSGVDAKSHPVMTELKRVQQYFEKIKAIENPETQRPNLALDKGAAGRFVKRALAGNDRLEKELRERIESERKAAKEKLGDMNRKGKRKAEGEDGDRTNGNGNADSNGGQKKKRKGQKKHSE